MAKYNVEMIKRIYKEDFEKFKEKVKRDLDETKDCLKKQRLKEFLKELN